MRFGGSWGEDDPGARCLASASSSCINWRRQIRSREGWQKPPKWQGIATNFDKSTCRLLFSPFFYLGCVCLAVCARRTTLKSEPLHLSDGASSSTARHGLAVLLLVMGWYDLLLTRCLHASPLTIALHVVTVYVMCVCREYVGSKANDEGEGKRKNEGRNGFDEQPL